MKIGPEYAEKRIFCRMSITAELTYRISSDDRIHRGQCKNLSHSGMQFQTETCLKEGTTLKITIDTKSEKIKPMNALIEIIRVKPSENNQYIVAGKILEYK